jgi:hypothetical protein
MPTGIAGLDIVSFGGHAINDGSIYGADFELGDSDIFSTFRGEVVEAERVDNFPVHVRIQPRSTDFTITIEILTLTQANYDQLKQWFNPALGEQYLIATDGSSVGRRRLCSVRELATNGETTIFTVGLHAVGPWEQNTAPTPTTRNITNTGDTFTLSNTGSGLAYPTFTITPNTIKDAADDYITRQRVVLANRTELGPLDDPEGDGYPLKLDGGALSSPGDDVRLIIKGREYNRWISSDALWANVQLQPRKMVTLAADFDDTSVEDITVNEELDEDAWPSQGFILFEDTDEVIQYNLTGLQSFSDITRGAIGTTATAHSAGESIFFVEQGAWIDIISGKSSPGSPPFPSNKMPAIDLAASSNTTHVWAEPHINLDTESRSRCWQRGLTDDGESSQHVRSYNDSGQAVFEDLLPSAGKPLGNDLSMNFPVPIKADAGAFTADIDVDESLVLLGFVEDIEGNESRLLTEYWSNGSQSKSYGPGDLISNIRLHGRLAAILGNLSLPPDLLPSIALTVLTGKVNITDSQGDQVTLDVTAQLAEGIAFKLEADVPIAAFLVYLESAVTNAFLIFDDPPSHLITSTAVAASSGLTFVNLFSANNTEVILPAGNYVALWAGAAAGNEGIQNTRIEPFVYRVKHALQPLEFIDSHGVTFHISDQEWFHQYEHENQSPIFSVLSRTAELQSDAPLNTENKARVENITAILDETRAPYVATGAEADLYLLQCTLTNTTTDQAFTIFHPMNLGQNIVIDCEARTITDGETGMEIPFAFTGEWPHLQPGNNVFSYDEAGVVSVTVAESHRDRWL